MRVQRTNLRFHCRHHEHGTNYSVVVRSCRKVGENPVFERLVDNLQLKMSI